MLRNEAITVLQHEYAITSAVSVYPILNTVGAGPCVILALYNSDNKMAFLAHIDIQTDIDSLKKIFNTFLTESTVAHIAGGDISVAFSHISNIISFLLKLKIPIMSENIGKSSLAIDARTGEISISTKMNIDNDFLNRFSSYSSVLGLGTPLKKVNVPTQVSTQLLDVKGVAQQKGKSINKKQVTKTHQFSPKYEAVILHYAITTNNSSLFQKISKLGLEKVTSHEANKKSLL